MSDVRDVLELAAAELEAADRILEHGRRAAYQAGCKCPRCLEANAVYQARYRLKVVMGRPLLGKIISGHATAQRIRSLHADGYSLRQLARLLGMSKTTIRKHTTSCPGRARTAVKVGRFWRDQQLPLDEA